MFAADVNVLPGDTNTALKSERGQFLLEQLFTVLNI
jgi:hypothetical protein